MGQRMVQRFNTLFKCLEISNPNPSPGRAGIQNPDRGKPSPARVPGPGWFPGYKSPGFENPVLKCPGPGRAEKNRACQSSRAGRPGSIGLPGPSLLQGCSMSSLCHEIFENGLEPLNFGRHKIFLLLGFFLIQGSPDH